MTAWKELGDYLRETQLLGSIQSTLYWDQNTSMPPGGSSWRGEQLSLLARKLHKRQSCEYFESLVQEAKIELENDSLKGDLDKEEISNRKLNIKLLIKDLKRQKSIDSSLISKLAIAKADGYGMWQEAKLKADFNLFSGPLENLIFLRKEEANQLSENLSCWETLAQPYEPDITKKRLEELFSPLRKRLPELIDIVRSKKTNPSKRWDLDEKFQIILCEKLLKEWSRDPMNTTIAKSPHPFSITLGPNDFRITSRIVPLQPLSCFLATAHEWGHSLYEQGLPSQTHQWFAWPLGQATSMGVHESQSLFWENRVARSLSFCEKFWKNFANFGAPINSADDLWRLMNPLAPGLNRVEADELSYGLHILIRTDLEIDLLERGLNVSELPFEWNKRYEELLGVTPKNDSEGCLQDVHWSEGAFGYFPSYLLGHLISAQLAEGMSTDLKDIGVDGKDPILSCISNSEESKLIGWLREKVHCLGRKVNAESLVELVTGQELSSQAFLMYLENKLDLLSINS